MLGPSGDVRYNKTDTIEEQGEVGEVNLGESIRESIKDLKCKGLTNA